MDIQQEIENDRWFTVSGLIINDPNGPRCFCDFYEALTPQLAEDMAKTEVRSWVVEGRHGVLFVANVFQGKVKPVNTYAVYADDSTRAEGYRPQRGWKPPEGYEGIWQ